MGVADLDGSASDSSDDPLFARCTLRCAPFSPVARPWAAGFRGIRGCRIRGTIAVHPKVTDEH